MPTESTANIINEETNSQINSLNEVRLNVENENVVPAVDSVPSIALPTKVISDIAETVVGFTKNKTEKIAGQLLSKKKQMNTIKKDIQEKKKKIRTLKDSKENLEKKYDQLIKSEHSELVKKYQEIIIQLKQHPLIEDFKVDTNQRIVLTTTMLTVVRDSWKSPKEIGKFQIRIDFSKETYEEGVRVLNITKRFADYDSPTIRETRCCWGNIAADIEQEFDTQDLYELIIDLLDYIQSPNVKAGYLSKDGDREKGWEQFLDNITLQPKNYCFEKYDQDTKAKSVSERISPNFTEDFGSGLEALQRQYDGMLSYVTTAATTASFTAADIALQTENELVSARDFFRRWPNNDGIENALTSLGLNDHLAYCYAGIISYDITRINSNQSNENKLYIYVIETSPSEREFSVYEIIVRLSRSMWPTLERLEAPVPSEEIEMMTLRYYISSGDIGNLRRRSFRFPPPPRSRYLEEVLPIGPLIDF